MDATPLVKGIVIGFIIAAPVGPVGVLCIRRALADGQVAAFVAGLGAAVADTIYGAVAALGLTLVTDFLTDHRVGLSLSAACSCCSWAGAPCAPTRKCCRRRIRISA